MAWYYGTHSCGHEGRTYIVGPQKNRQSKADWIFSRPCPECSEREWQETLKKQKLEAKEKADEMDLPALTGTEKQTAWANSIRVNLIEKLEARILKSDESKLKEFFFPRQDGTSQVVSTSIKELLVSLDYAVQNHTDARFWIDNRDNRQIFCVFFEEYLDCKAKSPVPPAVEDELKKQEESLTVVPDCDSPKSGVVRIKNSDGTLSAEYVKDADFMDIVKKLGYKWDGSVWVKKITEYTGTFDDRAADLGNMLLGRGFVVQFPDADIRDHAVTGNYAKENDRWIKYHIKDGQLAIEWGQRSDTLYAAARKLPGAHWDRCMMVPLEFYKEVEDFAETMGFSISRMAREEIEKYKQRESRFETKHISPTAPDDVNDEERIARSLRSSGTIIEDLADE